MSVHMIGQPKERSLLVIIVHYVSSVICKSFTICSLSLSIASRISCFVLKRNDPFLYVLTLPLTYNAYLS